MGTSRAPGEPQSSPQLQAAELALDKLLASIEADVAQSASIAHWLRTKRKRLAELRAEIAAEEEALDARRRFFNAVEEGHRS